MDNIKCKGHRDIEPFSEIEYKSINCILNFTQDGNMIHWKSSCCDALGLIPSSAKVILKNQ